MVWRCPLKRNGLRRHGAIEDWAISSNVVLDPDLVASGMSDEWWV